MPADPRRLPGMETTETLLHVSGMSCHSCVARIRRALSLDGVTDVEVALDRGTVTVRHSEAISERRLIAALESAGYGATARSGCCCG